MANCAAIGGLRSRTVLDQTLGVCPRSYCRASSGSGYVLPVVVAVFHRRATCTLATASSSRFPRRCRQILLARGSVAYASPCTDHKVSPRTFPARPTRASLHNDQSSTRCPTRGCSGYHPKRPLQHQPRNPYQLLRRAAQPQHGLGQLVHVKGINARRSAATSS